MRKVGASHMNTAGARRGRGAASARGAGFQFHGSLGGVLLVLLTWFCGAVLTLVVVRARGRPLRA